MPARIDPAEVLVAQKALRTRLLDRREAIGWQPARDLAAQLLLRLDDAAACWQFSVEWIRSTFHVERVDGGYASPEASVYCMGSAEARSKDIDVPSLQGIAIDNRDPCMVKLWSSPDPVVFTEMAQEKLLRDDLRRRLVEAGTCSKIAVALRADGTRFGLLCIDRVGRDSRWTGMEYDRFHMLAGEVLMPVLSAAAKVGLEPPDLHADSRTGNVQECGLHLLTKAELEVARLAATGMSYKEIARVQNRAFSTIDHQLRSIRRKLGVTSGGRLVSILRSAGAWQ